MTHNIVNDPCFGEGHAITRQLIGANPSHRDVTLWGVGGAAMHLGVSHFLLEHGHSKTFTVWQAISIADTGYSVGKGLSIGVRFWGSNKPRTCSP